MFFSARVKLKDESLNLVGTLRVWKNENLGIGCQRLYTLNSTLQLQVSLQQDMLTKLRGLGYGR